jgi:hypothetical protein
MIVKWDRFIRLDEIEEKTNLTRKDILDAVNRGRLEFAAQVEGRCMGALLKRDDCLKVAGLFDFNGMVKLLPETSKRFAQSFKPQLTSILEVIEPEKIMNWRSVSEVFPNTEGTYCPYLTRGEIQPMIPFVAYALMESAPHTEASSSMDSMYLKNGAISIELENLRLDMQEIVNLFG